MANEKHLQLLRAGVQAWNEWRMTPAIRFNNVIPDLSQAQLQRANLKGYNLERANLWKANLCNANLQDAKLSFAQMSDADFSGANLNQSEIKFAILSRTKLIDAKLRHVDLRCSSLRRATLQRADLTGAILRHASLAEAEIEGAKLNGAEVYGAGIWGLIGEPAEQKGLIIQPNYETPPITVDDLDIAQLLFVLLDNPKIAQVIEATSSRTVLILGRFTPARKRVLDAIKTRLLERNFVPILFDFPKPGGRDLTETAASLAHMACFKCSNRIRLNQA